MKKVRLTVQPMLFHTSLRMQGLSFKKADLYELCKDETGFHISNDFHRSPRTAMIEKDYLIKILAELHENMPFDSIRIVGHYEATGEELMNEIIKINLIK